MRKHYDFSQGERNRYAKRLKRSVTIRLDEATVEYFKALAEELILHGSQQNVANADAVVVNPTHIAVALRYERGRDEVPVSRDWCRTARVRSVMLRRSSGTVARSGSVALAGSSGR